MWSYNSRILFQNPSYNDNLCLTNRISLLIHNLKKKSCGWTRNQEEVSPAQPELVQ